MTDDDWFGVSVRPNPAVVVAPSGVLADWLQVTLARLVPDAFIDIDKMCHLDAVLFAKGALLELESATNSSRTDAKRNHDFVIIAEDPESRLRWLMCTDLALNFQIASRLISRDAAVQASIVATIPCVVFSRETFFGTKDLIAAVVSALGVPLSREAIATALATAEEPEVVEDALRRHAESKLLPGGVVTIEQLAAVKAATFGFHHRIVHGSFLPVVWHRNVLAPPTPTQGRTYRGSRALTAVLGPPRGATVFRAGVETTLVPAVLQFFPHLYVPTGRWSFEVAVQLDRRMVGTMFRLETRADGVTGGAWFHCKAPGVFAARFVVTSVDPGAPVEIIFEAAEPGALGRIDVHSVTITPQPPLPVNT